jgi:multidrug resistance efflux pump
MIDYSTSFYITLGFSVFMFLAGFLLGRQGVSGIESDVASVKADVSTIKGQVLGTGTPVAIVPVTGNTTTAVA